MAIPWNGCSSKHRRNFQVLDFSTTFKSLSSHSKSCAFSPRRFWTKQERAWVPVRTVTKQNNMAEFPELGKHCDVQTCKQLGKSGLVDLCSFFHWLNVLVTLAANSGANSGKWIDVYVKFTSGPLSAQSFKVLKIFLNWLVLRFSFICLPWMFWNLLVRTSLFSFKLKYFVDPMCKFNS